VTKLSGKTTGRGWGQWLPDSTGRRVPALTERLECPLNDESKLIQSGKALSDLLTNEFPGGSSSRV
jgi:hypothetical protein